ncbi:hypothetical protein C7391_0104 [Methanimicrococcus blatticola]|uniref:Uncharacterized protein n=1 Tax=Methanimicrococcus blatticola TaxID=91560 RepID=A0A484F7A6_9EURY|nr:hypothetical protein C7391_0104 [Methanimicrococcus blatticola]
MDPLRILQFLAVVGFILIIWNGYILLSTADINSISTSYNQFFWMIVGVLLIAPLCIYGREETNKNA